VTFPVQKHDQTFVLGRRVRDRLFPHRNTVLLKDGGPSEIAMLEMGVKSSPVCLAMIRLRMPPRTASSVPMMLLGALWGQRCSTSSRLGAGCGRFSSADRRDIDVRNHRMLPEHIDDEKLPLAPDFADIDHGELLPQRIALMPSMCAPGFTL